MGGLLGLLVVLIGIALLAYGAVTLVGGGIILGIVLILVGIVVIGFGSGRVAL